MKAVKKIVKKAAKAAAKNVRKSKTATRTKVAKPVKSAKPVKPKAKANANANANASAKANAKADGSGRRNTKTKKSAKSARTGVANPAKSRTRNGRGASPAKAEGWHGWDTYAAFYDWENARTVGRRDVKFWRDVARRTGGRTLELGCGTGRILVPLARAGVDIVGIDRSRPMLARAITRVKQLSAKAKAAWLANPDIGADRYARAGATLTLSAGRDGQIVAGNSQPLASASASVSASARALASSRAASANGSRLRSGGGLRGERSTGTDMDSAVLALPQAALLRGDIRQLPFEPGTFDLVMAPYGILQSLVRERDLSETLRAVFTALAPGGVFGLDLVPDVPRWEEYARRVSLRGRRGPRGVPVTLVESVRQDRAKRLTIFDQEFIEGRGRAQQIHRFSLTFRTVSIQSLRARLERAGFLVDAVLGGYDGRPWDPRADVWVLMASKPRT